MITMLKVVSVLSCGLLLCLGLSTAAHAGEADETGTSRLERAKTIKGELLRVEYGDYVVKEKDGKEVRLTTDKTTQMMGQLKKGDRIEAKVNDQNHALLIRKAE
jgi:ribosomal protein L25 (general stress protein Ctc)